MQSVEEQISTTQEQESKWKSRQRTLWAKRASLYNQLNWATESTFLKDILDHCPISPGAAVLDVGIGTGAVAKVVAPHVKSVTGIDICPEMIARLKSNESLAHIECFEADVQNMPFADNTFDLSIARMVFHHVEDCVVGLQEVLRVLKPGGHLVLVEGVPPDHRTRERYEQIFALKEERHTFSEAELINMFHWAGFSHISLYPYFMKQVSLNNWLDNSALPDSNIKKIRQLHLEADDYFKKVYQLNVTDGDVLMDWKFVILIGEKG